MKSKRVFFAGIIFSFILAAAGPARAQTWNLSAGGSWNAAANWAPPAVPNATGALAVFNGGSSPGGGPAQSANRTVTLDGAQTVGLILFNNDAGHAFTTSLTTGSGGSLTLDNFDAGPATITLPNGSGTENYTISAPTILTDSLVAQVNNVVASSAAGALNLTAAISGPGGFTKEGAGLATFGTGAKTYTGPTILNGGRMRISVAAHPTSTSGLTINSNAQLTLISAGAYAFGSNAIHLNGSGPTNGPFAAFPGAIRPDTGLVIGISNAVVLDSDTVIHVQGSSGAITFSNVVSGPGRLTLTAPSHDANLGSLVFTRPNSYSGGTVVHGGTIVLEGSLSHGTPSSLGSGNVIVESANATFAGATARLWIQTGVLNGIADRAILSLAGGKVAGAADDGHIILESAVNEVVGGLILGGVPQPPGTYGSTSSGAANQNDEYFSGPGILTVTEFGPILAISRSAPNVVLSWPTNFPGFTLQQTPVLVTPTNTWTNVTNAVAVSGTNYTVTMNAASGNSFFRLAK